MNNKENRENLKEEIKSLKRCIDDYKVEITYYRNICFTLSKKEKSSDNQKLLNKLY